jgi:tetratricopeptide (TPR) repeat protein|tara:strand:- start:55 stop:570 length:516 start_codon:yes stop_codon:yes gene_type:complete
MFPKVIKLILAVLAFAFGIYQFIDDYIGNGIMMLLLSGMFVLLYFKNEMIFLAFLRLRKQDFEGTEKWLMRIPNIQRNLVRKQQGYYNYLLGIIHSQKNLTQSEKYFKTAISLGLSMNHDLAMAKMSLAGIYLQKRRKREAQQLLTEAKKLDKHGMLSGQLKMIQQQMKRI